MFNNFDLEKLIVGLKRKRAECRFFDYELTVDEVRINLSFL